MKIGILGGSFDPPHIGHLLIAQQVIEKAPVDQIWFMPVFSTAAHNKIFQKELSSSRDRFSMIKLLEGEKIKASDFEINRNKKSLTIETLQKLTKEYPEHTFYWILGSDRLATFHLWDDWQEILHIYHLIVFPREQSDTNLKKEMRQSLQLQTIPENVIVLQNKELIVTNISSTIIRDRVKNGLPIDFLVPQTVERYIKKHRLYEK